MAEMLLINPRRRRRAAKASARRRPAARRAPARRRARRRNPTAAPATVVQRAMRRTAKRRANPIGRIRRRRRNPIRIGGSARNSIKGILGMLQDAAIGGAGAIAVDVLFGKLNPHLPATLQTNPTTVGIGDAVKAVLTCVVGNLLSKPTKGLSKKAAMGALTTQARDILSTFLPASIGLGYATPGRVIRGNARIGPNQRVVNMNAYQRGGGTPLLSGVNAYTSGASPLLNGSTAREREGFRFR